METIQTSAIGYYATLHYLGAVWTGADYGYLEAYLIHTYDGSRDFHGMRALQDRDVRLALGY